MTPSQSHGCTVDLAPGAHRITVDMEAVTGTFVLRLRDSAGVVFHETSCRFEPTQSGCLGWSGGSGEATADGGGTGSISLVVTHSHEYVSATFSKGGTASLEVGPGIGTVALDVS